MFKRESIQRASLKGMPEYHIFIWNTGMLIGIAKRDIIYFFHRFLKTIWNYAGLDCLRVKVSLKVFNLLLWRYN